MHNFKKEDPQNLSPEAEGDYFETAPPEPAPKPQEWNTDALRELKRMGMPRPEGCPMSHWNEPEEINHRHDKILELLLDGVPKNKIAQALNMDYAYTLQIINSPKFKNEYRNLRNEREANVTKARLSHFFQDAAKTIGEIMNNKEEKGATRLSAAMYIADQSVGKSRQDIEVKTNVLSDVLIRLEEMKSRPVSEQSKTLDKPKDHLDNFVDSFITTEFKVGTRGISDEGSESEAK